MPNSDDLEPEELDAIVEQAHVARREREQADLKAVMSTPEGRRVIHRILYDLAGVKRLGWSVDHATTSFYAGARNLGLQLLDELNKSCRGLVRIMDAENDDDTTPRA
jgi:hypothetical protein